MGGDEECSDEISHVLSQAAKFPPGCLERRGFALLYWQHAGTGSHSTEQEKGAYRSQIHEDGPMKHLKCPRGLHQYLCGHPNGLFIVGLAKEHIALQMCGQGKNAAAGESGTVNVSRIDFLPKDIFESLETEEESDAREDTAIASPVNETLSAAKCAKVTSRTRGKKQKGGFHVRRDTLLARVVLSNGRVFPVFGGVQGQVVELNDNLSTHPDLLQRQPEHKGYIAIIQPPRFSSIGPDLSHLINSDTYKKMESENYLNGSDRWGEKDVHAQHLTCKYCSSD